MHQAFQKTAPNSDKIIFILVSLIIFCFGKQLYAVEVHTYRENDAWVTEGKINAEAWFTEGYAVILNFDTYKYWLLKGLDGKDQRSASYWEQFKDFQFYSPDKVILVYDINLGWPFGSKGNKLKFRLDFSHQTSKELHIRLEDKLSLIEEAEIIILAVEDENKAGSQESPKENGDFIFKIHLKFAWLLDALIDSAGYSKHMNEIIETVVNNLKNYCTRNEL